MERISHHLEKATKKRGSAQTRRIRASLVFMVALAVVLTTGSAFFHRRDVDIALGGQSSEQAAFFEQAADRPDIATFFKELTPSQKLVVARNLGRYDSPRLPKLIGILLGDFDAPARDALTESLAAIAHHQPQAVAVELKTSGSFQQAGVRKALHSLGDASLPVVAKALETPETAENAKAYLIEYGPAAIPFLLAALEKDESRAAAIDALGKLRASEAVPALMHLAVGSDFALPLVTALASIGDTRSQDLLSGVLADTGKPIPVRQQAALGLGLIATAPSVTTLLKAIDSGPNDLQPTITDALILAGDSALRQLSQQKDHKAGHLVEVALGVHTAFSSQVLRQAWSIPNLRMQVAAGLGNRPELTPFIVGMARESSANGEIVDLLMRALSTTPEGRHALASLNDDPQLGGFATRQLALSVR